MTDLRTAAQQALEALEAWPSPKRNAVIKTLRAALEQPEQGPVAWTPSHIMDRQFYPPRREWRGLTEEEAAACWSVSTVRTWQAIEAALKERNA